MRLRYFMSVVVLLSYVFLSSEESVSHFEDPTAFYSMIELVCSEGYHIQEHIGVTDDGYVLKIYRIPGGKRRPKTPKRKHHYQYLHEGYHPDFAACVNDSLNVAPVGPPVLLSHGLVSASDVWVLQGSDSDLAFMLADKDYDIWFSNIRGNFYSRRHKTLKPSEKAFWDFSFHENGVYDIPTTIDVILNQTGSAKLFYVGHSMGCTMFFVMASEKPEYRDKITLMVGLTPVAQIIRKNFSSSRLNVLKATIELVRALERIGVYEFLQRNYISSVFIRSLCWKGSPFQDLCYDLGFFYTGFHSKLFLRKNLMNYVTHALGGSSVKTFLHYDQLLDAPFFQQFDYGPEENKRRYGQTQPPQYSLWNITVPTALYYSGGDYIADPKDIAVLKSFLPNVVEDHQVAHYSHVDFLWAYTAKELIYRKVVEVVDKFRISGGDGRQDSTT